MFLSCLLRKNSKILAKGYQIRFAQVWARQEASGKPKRFGSRGSMVAKLKLIKINIHKDQDTKQFKR
jgi:hypothetical protein